MTDRELLTRIIVLVNNADKAQDQNALDGDDDSISVDIDYDTYQEIHKLLRVNDALDNG